MYFGELFADIQPVAPTANDVFEQGPEQGCDAVTAAEATAVVVASEGVDRDERGDCTSNEAFGGNSK